MSKRTLPSARTPNTVRGRPGPSGGPAPPPESGAQADGNEAPGARQDRAEDGASRAGSVWLSPPGVWSAGGAHTHEPLGPGGGAPREGRASAGR